MHHLLHQLQDPQVYQSLVSVWNTVYLTEATKLLKEKGNLREDLLKHISPLGWEHINFLVGNTLLT